MHTRITKSGNNIFLDISKITGLRNYAEEGKKGKALSTNIHESNIDEVIPASKMQGEDKQWLF